MTIKIIGVGNMHRGDDAAGLLAASDLRRKLDPEINVIETIGEPTKLLAAWGDAETVILIDASAPSGNTGCIKRIVAGEAPLPKEASASSTHSLSLADAIELAETLGERPARIIIFAIEGVNFGIGEELSPAVERALPLLVEQVKKEISTINREAAAHA